jgi:predicted phage replisome organizer
MEKLKWFKVDPDIFNDEKIRIIETMPDADGVIVVWFKLLALAARSTSDGVLMFDEGIPYDTDTLAAIFNRKKQLVELSLNVFEKYRMIEFFENGAIYITNWEKYQNIDYLNKVREQTRNRVAAHRERKKLENNNDVSRDSNVTVTLRNADVTQQIENKSKKENKKEKKKKEVQLGSLSAAADVPISPSEISEYWNSHSGLKSITGLTDRRKDFVRLRIKQARDMGMDPRDAILKTIDNCRHSPFLQGENNRNWMATFDWVFGKPTNFIKVLEGNYVKERYAGNNDDLKARAERLARTHGGDEECA